MALFSLFWSSLSWKLKKIEEICRHTTESSQQQKFVFGLLCFYVLLINKKHKLCRVPSYEHSFQVWLQRRRLKCKSLWTTTSTMTAPMPTTDAKWWQYPTWPFRSVELITLQSCIWLTNNHFKLHAKNKNICIIQAIYIQTPSKKYATVKLLL